MEIIMQLGERDIGPNGTTLERQQGRSASAVAAEKKKDEEARLFSRVFTKERRRER